MDRRSKKRLHTALMERIEVASFLEEALGERETGGNFHCPFAEDRHDSGTDSSPSFSVDADTGKAFCHSCGYRASSLVGLWQDLNGTDFEGALRSLWSEGVEPVVSEAAIRKSHGALIANPLMLSRLEDKRGVTESTVRRFQLGWKGDRVWIPVRNQHGLAVDVRRYDLMRRAPAGMKVVSYRKGYGGARIFPEAELTNDTLYLCEGEMDALALLDLGIPAVSITSGALTMRAELARRFRGKAVLIIPDNDRAGRDGAAKRARALTKAGASSVSIVRLPVQKRGEDVTDWLVKYGGDPHDLPSMVEQTVSGEPAPERVTEQVPSVNGSLFDLKDSEAEAIDRSDLLLDTLNSRGMFLRDEMGGIHYATHGGEVMDVTASGRLSRFSTHLAELSAAVNPATAFGRFASQHIRTSAALTAARGSAGSWSMARGASVYVHQDDCALKVKPKKVERTRKLAAEESVVLLPPREGTAFKYNPKVSAERGMAALMNALRYVAACQEDRYLIAAWLLCSFMRDCVRAKPQLRFVASSGAGKSSASKVLSHIVYGDDLILSPDATVASAYSEASRMPVLIWDNIETRNLSPQLEDFMLIAATGATKTKRAMDTDTGVVAERANCLLITNGIEPYSRNELISRTVEVPVDVNQFGVRDYFEWDAIRRVAKSRNVILSGGIKVLSQHVLPRFARGEVSRIAREIGPNEMARFNDYFALMALFLDAIFAYVPDDRWASPRQLVKRWIRSQDQGAQDRKVGTSEVVEYLSAVVELGDHVDGVQRVLKPVGRNKVQFKTTTEKLLWDVNLVARYLGKRSPWKNAQHLGSRIKDAKSALKSRGWTHVRKKQGGYNVQIFTLPKPKKGGEL